MEPKTNVVLVHGAWANGSSWSKVIPLLQNQGFNVTAVQLPLTPLDDDIAVTRNALAAKKGPTGLAANAKAEKNKAIVLKAFDTLFNRSRR